MIQESSFIHDNLCDLNIEYLPISRSDFSKYIDDVAADLNYPPVQNIRRSTDKILSDKTFLLNGSNTYEWDCYHINPRI